MSFGKQGISLASFYIARSSWQAANACTLDVTCVPDACLARPFGGQMDRDE